ncbi:MAG: PQQ-dependent sugar dehydrogenase [Actinomycetota bacterium]|nr:PQQ-dependent sugar dehydrogenase [Actinomycetota bacterium]MDA3006713.1 PQQ-dependent sugar dehydrogenase [Actinomycetota bacterium]MDA3033780.1 PQQ-dependent sugar dehydrogenase [Actinomycetota bacterium]
MSWWRIAALCVPTALVAGCGPSSSAPDEDSSPTTTVAIVDMPPSTVAPSTAPSTTALSPSADTPPTTDVPTRDPRPVAIAAPTVTITEIIRTAAVTDALAGPDGHLWVVTQDGQILDVDDDGRAVLDIGDLTKADGERGLLGVEIDDMRSVLWAHHTLADGDRAGDTVVAAYDLATTTDGWSVDPATRTELAHIAQPYANHNGGDLARAPDGTLLIATGDGGSAGDPLRVSQRLDSPLGKILRIDPGSDGRQALVPDDNPWPTGAEPTVFATGLRNPWRIDIDPLTGDLWVADVGQNLREEINRVPAPDNGVAGSGADFGWSRYEADLDFNADTSAPQGTETVWPVHHYDHGSAGCSISGGVVDRGPGLWGWYVFADLCAGEVRAFNHVSGDVLVLGRVDVPTSVARGPNNTLIVTAGDGAVYRVDIAPS